MSTDMPKRPGALHMLLRIIGAVPAAHVQAFGMVWRARLHLWQVHLGGAIYQAGETLSELGLRLSGADAAGLMTPEEQALSDRRMQDATARILARVRTPCPECQGKQYIRVPDGWEPCPSCDASGINTRS